MGNVDQRTGVFFVVGFLVVVCMLGVWAIQWDVKAQDVALLGFISFSAVIIAFAAAVLWNIIDGSIDLFGIISEPDDVANIDGKPKASLSRFQFLVFTFVVAGLFLMLSIEAGAFVNIPNNVLGLIGLSGGSFIVSKAVGPKAKDALTEVEKADATLKAAEIAAKKAGADAKTAEAKLKKAKADAAAAKVQE